MGAPVTLVDPEGHYVELVDVATITGNLASEDTSLALLASIGDPADAAWNGTDPEATIIALLKRIALNTEEA